MSNAVRIPSAGDAPRERSRLAEFFTRLVREKPLGTACGIFILFLIFVAIFAGTLAPYPYVEVHPMDRLQGPTSTYFLGTDHLGRDMLSRLIFGARVSLGIGLSATAVNVVVALFVGGASGIPWG